MTCLRWGPGAYWPSQTPKGRVLLAPIAIAVHLILSISLIALILLHAGRGGGLSDAFGGGMGPVGGMSGSTLVERNLDRLTVVVALLFATTTLALAFILD